MSTEFAMAGARSALIVATHVYDDQRLAGLRAPEHDAEALAEVLGDPDIGAFDVTTVLNRPWHEVSRAVAQFFRDRRPDDLALVHFSCHGLKDDSGELYFAATDTSLDLLEATAISASSVNRVMGRSRAGSVLLLLDCCYSGAFARGMTARAGGNVDVNERLGGRGRAVITASSALQFAFEGDAIADGDVAATSPSLFTSALVEGLRTGEADRDLDGWVSLDELYSYVHDEVTRTNPDQTPTKWAFDIEGDLRVARRGMPVTVPADLPAPLVGSMKSLYSWERTAVVEPLADLLNGPHPGLSLAARLALEDMASHDDSDRVKTAARAALASATTPAPPAELPAEPPAAPPSPPPTGPSVDLPSEPPPAAPATPERAPWHGRLSRRSWALVTVGALAVVGVAAWAVIARSGDDPSGGGGSSLSPLSRSYMVLTQVNGGPRQLVALDTRGAGNTIDIVDEPDAQRPSISQDRTHIAYLMATEDGQPGIAHVARPDGAEDQTLLTGDAVDTCPLTGRPTWRADSGYLAMVCYDTDGRTSLGIWTVRWDGSGLHRVVSWSSAKSSPSWGGDDRIYFVGNGNGNGSDGDRDQIYSVPSRDPSPVEKGRRAIPTWASRDCSTSDPPRVEGPATSTCTPRPARRG
jgi:hypothetical protein